MKQCIKRRELLKLLSFLPTTFFLPEKIATDRKKNVLIIVFDALSASNMSCYGYARPTMPNLEKYLDRATVFHNHYAGGNFTTPGTATLLTGTLPWTHRAYNVDATIAPQHVAKNIFQQFSQQGYFGLAYTHNPLADILLRQFRDSLNEHIPLHSLFLEIDWIEALFNNDIDNAVLAAHQIFTVNDGTTNSLFLTRLYKSMISKHRQQLVEKYAESFPNGPPRVGSSRYFLLETGINWLLENLPHTPQPFLGYFHFFPPHHPYITRVEYQESFTGDGYHPLDKPKHLFARGETPNSQVWFRRLYDESILYVDAEFGRLFDHLEDSGMLEDTIVVLTADHGELFERGIVGHGTATFFDPLIRIPLIIFEPGQQQRRDIHQTTSAADILPTLLHLTGYGTSDRCEGEILPPYHPTHNDQRYVFAVNGRDNAKNKPLTTASVMAIKWPYKLVSYWGYQEIKEEKKLELFNLAEDPEELLNLSISKPEIAKVMEQEIEEQLQQADAPYK